MDMESIKILITAIAVPYGLYMLRAINEIKKDLTEYKLYNAQNYANQFVTRADFNEHKREIRDDFVGLQKEIKKELSEFKSDVKEDFADLKETIKDNR